MIRSSFLTFTNTFSRSSSDFLAVSNDDVFISEMSMQDLISQKILDDITRLSISHASAID